MRPQADAWAERVIVRPRLSLYSEKDRIMDSSRLLKSSYRQWLVSLVIFSAACSNGSVVSQQSEANTAPAAVATPAVSNSQTPQGVAASPVATPAAAVAVPSSTPAFGATPGPNEQAGRGNMGGVVTSAKPMLTPAPDPFPPRPTPTIVLSEGRIQQQWAAPAEAMKLSNPFKTQPDAAARGRELYLQKCADCHGKHGQGNGYIGQNLKRDGKPLLPTNLASRMVQANSDGELFWKITNGRSPMPAHRVRFEDDQRWLIVSFLRTLKE
jgi:mono/diheme cytochrome c family protein